ncbi:MULTISPECIES: sensor histidine kinase [Arenibacter]|uniref:sensor histidine kinase n=1 Tax=Arenibacter TaxID=178469 RepID=UPI0018646F0F|nr:MULTISPECIES: HAMP domain-containing sensor histidine kinase [Arenibacter]
MTLDYPSILFFLALNNLFIIALFIYQYFYQHKQWCLLLVALGITFQMFAIVLYANREILPPLFTLRINNFLLIASFALTSFGLISFDGKIRKTPMRIYLVLAFLFYSAILVVEENYTQLSVIRVISCSFFFGIGAFYLFINKNKYKFSILLSGILLIYSVFQLIRAFRIYQMGDSFVFLKNSTFNNWFLVVSVLVISAISIGFIMLLKEVDQKTILKKNMIIEQDKRKLEALNLTQNKLFSIIAHDLRSPFINILGLSDLLVGNIKDSDDPESEKYTELINSTAKNTLSLLDNLLNWAKSQTGELGFSPEKIRLSKVILEILELKMSLAKAKNISLNYSPTEEIELHTDKNILGTILRNLISNAIKFTNLDGHIEVVAKVNQNQVEISISDNGVGMDKETIHKIFDLSANLTSRGTANENGSGLGLVLCKEFVKKLDGHLWVESEEGKGSNFKFMLPLTVSKQKMVKVA